MVLTKAWELYKENWKLIIGIVVLVGIILGIIKAVTIYLNFSFATMNGYKESARILLIILNLILWIGHLFWMAPLIYALNKLHTGVITTIKDAFIMTFNNFRKISILAGIITGIFFLIYVLPTYIQIEYKVVLILLLVTLILVVWHALIIPVWFLEDRHIGEALSYSRKLLEGKRLAFVLELIAIYILIYVFMYLFSFIVFWPINKLVAINDTLIYLTVFFSAIMRVLYTSVVVVWLYCYYQELKESDI